MKNHVLLFCIVISLALTTAFDVRLVRMSWKPPNQGLVQFKFESKIVEPWYGMCTDAFESVRGSAANLICKKLTNFETATGRVFVSGGHIITPTNDSVTLNCFGHKTDISECDFQIVSCDHEPALALECTVPGVELNIATQPVSCEDPNYFACKTVKCIYRSWICDGHTDCDSGEDEENCIDYMHQFDKFEKQIPTTQPQQTWRKVSVEGCARKCAEAREFICASFAFQRMNTSTSKCLLNTLNQEFGISLRSDPNYDYYERSVELNTTTCNFTCFNGKCISCNKCICDNVKDCSDGSDEKYCGEMFVTSPCPSIGRCPLTCIGGLHMDEHHCYECKCNEVVKIAANRFDVRIVGGSKPNEGRVEVHMNGTWGVICDKNWSRDSANVLCREAGFHRGVGSSFKYITAGQFGNGNENFLMTNVSCHGIEPSIQECNFDRVGISCAHNAAAVNCFARNIGCGPQKFRCDKHTCIYNDQVCDGKVDCVNGIDEDNCNSTLRLVNGPNQMSGRVEILHNGIWGSVYRSKFSHADAQVICRSLGYLGDSVAHSYRSYDSYGSGIILLDRLNCYGFERNIYECENTEWFEFNFERDDGAAVTCEEGNEEVTDIPPAVENILPDICGNRSIVDNPPSQIVTSSKYGVHPWRIRVKHENSYTYGSPYYCEGTIISEFYILSSTNCFISKDLDMSHYKVLVGDFNYRKDDEWEEYSLNRMILHENYDKGVSRNNDIALLKINANDEGRGFRFGSHVGSVCLPSFSTEYTPGTKCVVSGWDNYLDILQSVEVSILNRTFSTQFHPFLSAGMFCVDGIEECNSGMGGPLVCENSDRFALYGIHSWGGCGSSNKPGIYTNVKHYLRWIYDKLEEDANK